MEAKELRIGNLVYYHDENLQPKDEVCKISYMDIAILFNKEKYHHYSPIPLTEEWLLKFGLNDGVFPANQYFSISRLISNNEFWGLYFENEFTATDIQYVHQLQNLYFALTGEELTQ